MGGVKKRAPERLSRTVAPRAPTLAIDARSPYAEPGSRMAAAAIDALLAGAPHLLLLPLGVAIASPALVHTSVWLGFLATGALFVVDLVLLSRYGQTVGKRIVGVRIVRSDGSRASLARLFWLRMALPGVVAMIPLVGWLFELADMAAIFGDERRTLHDRIADTIVVDLRAPLAERVEDLAETFA